MTMFEQDKKEAETKAAQSPKEDGSKLVPFSRNGVTVFRPVSQTSDLAKEGWVRT